jgi:hypothetical protein
VRARPLALALSLAASTARAQTARPPPRRVQVAPLACATPGFDPAPWRDLLRTELESDGVEEVRFEGASEGAMALIQLDFPRCATDASAVVLEIDDALTNKSVRREVDLGDVPASGRPRALALAAAELLRASWAELALPPPRATPAPAAPAPVRLAVTQRLRDALRASEPPAPRMTLRRWDVNASFVLQTFPAANVALLGGRVALSYLPSPQWPLRVRLDLAAQSGTAFDPLGEIDLGMVTAALGATLTAGGERVALELGPRVEAGWSWVTGRPTVAGVRGGQGDAAVFFLSVLATLRVRVSPRWWTTLDATAGTPLRPVVIESGAARAAGFTGPMLTLGLGVAVAL